MVQLILIFSSRGMCLYSNVQTLEYMSMSNVYTWRSVVSLRPCLQVPSSLLFEAGSLQWDLGLSTSAGLMTSGLQGPSHLLSLPRDYKCVQPCLTFCWVLEIRLRSSSTSQTALVSCPLKFQNISFPQSSQEPFVHIRMHIILQPN